MPSRLLVSFSLLQIDLKDPVFMRTSPTVTKAELAMYDASGSLCGEFPVLSFSIVEQELIKGTKNKSANLMWCFQDRST